jgi:hypothetical protein
MAGFEAEGGTQHQATGYQRPGRYHEDEGEHGDARPERRGDADRDPEQAVEQKPSPPFAIASASHGQHDAEEAVDEAIGGEEEDEREHRGAGHDEGGDSEQDRQYAA